MISTLAKSMVWPKAAGAIANVANNSHARRIVSLPSILCAGLRVEYPQYAAPNSPGVVGWAKAVAHPFHEKKLSCAVPTLSVQPAWARRTIGITVQRFSASAFAHPTA